MAVTTIPTAGIADGAVDTAQLADDAVTAAKSSGLGISQADFWLFNSDPQIAAKTFTTLTNWARPTDTDDEYGRIGTGLSVSSGIFTFPETGIYEITCMLTFTEIGNNSPLNYNEIQVTDDGGSTYDSAATSLCHLQTTNPNQNSCSVSGFLLDVTSTTNVKIRVRAYCDEICKVYGEALNAYSFIRFTRLGDT